MTSLTNVVLFHYDRTLSRPTIMRNFIAAAMQKHSSSRGGNAAMAYDAALREALTLIARNPSDPDRVRGMLDNRSLWAADPLHPGEGDPEMCPNFMWAHLNNITYDNCIKALGNKFSSIADTVPEGEGLALLNQMYQQAEPEGLGAVEDIESEMNECLYVDGNDITEHLTALQALIKKYDRASTIPLTEEKKKRFLLKTLPSTWQTPVQNWEAGPLTFQDLLPRIKEFTTSVSYVKMKEQGLAMVGGVLECFHCGGNHRIRDCPDLPPPRSSGGRQTKFRDRGKGRQKFKRSQRMSRKDASALVSMLHVLSNSWISSDEEEDQELSMADDQDNPEVAMPAKSDLDRTSSDQSINGNLTGDVISLITQSRNRDPDRTLMDGRNRDRDRDRDRDLEVPHRDTSHTDFDKDFDLLFQKRLTNPEPQIYSDWPRAENQDQSGFYAKNEIFDMCSAEANQTGKSSLQVSETSNLSSNAQNRHRGGLYAKNVNFEQSIVVDSWTQKNDYGTLKRSQHRYSEDPNITNLSAHRISDIWQYSVIGTIWCILFMLAEKFSTIVMLAVFVVGMICANVWFSNIWSRATSVTKFKTVFQTSVLPVVCQPKLMLILVMIGVLSALSHLAMIPKVSALTDHTALVGDLPAYSSSNYAYGANKFLADPIQWEQQLLSSNSNTFSVDFAVDSGCSTNTTNRQDVFLSMAPSNLKVITAEGAESEANGTGYSLATVRDTENNTVMTKMQLLYMPNFHFNLLSVIQLQDLGHAVVFKSKRSRQNSYIELANGKKIPLYRSGNLHYLKVTFPKMHTGLNVVKTKQVHESLGHLNFAAIKDMAKQKLLGSLKQQDVVPYFCDTCERQTQKSFIS